MNRKDLDRRVGQSPLRRPRSIRPRPNARDHKPIVDRYVERSTPVLTILKQVHKPNTGCAPGSGRRNYQRSSTSSHSVKKSPSFLHVSWSNIFIYMSKQWPVFCDTQRFSMQRRLHFRTGSSGSVRKQFKSTTLDAFGWTSLRAQSQTAFTLWAKRETIIKRTWVRKTTELQNPIWPPRAFFFFLFFFFFIVCFFFFLVFVLMWL